VRSFLRAGGLGYELLDPRFVSFNSRQALVLIVQGLAPLGSSTRAPPDPKKSLDDDVYCR
jgi:hypothetical protein